MTSWQPIFLEKLKRLQADVDAKREALVGASDAKKARAELEAALNALLREEDAAERRVAWVAGRVEDLHGDLTLPDAHADRGVADRESLPLWQLLAQHLIEQVRLAACRLQLAAAGDWQLAACSCSRNT